MKNFNKLILAAMLAGVTATSGYTMQDPIEPSEPATKKAKATTDITDLQRAIVDISRDSDHNPAPVIRLLEKGVDVNEVNESGDTALHWAAAENCIEIVKILLDAGADIDIKNLKGETALHDAARRGHKEIIKLLVLSGINTSIVNISGNTAMRTAIENDNKEIALFIFRFISSMTTQTETDTVFYNTSTKSL